MFGTSKKSNYGHASYEVTRFYYKTKSSASIHISLMIELCKLKVFFHIFLEGRDCDYYFLDEMVDGIDEIFRDFLRSRKMSK